MVTQNQEFMQHGNLTLPHEKKCRCEKPERARCIRTLRRLPLFPLSQHTASIQGPITTATFQQERSKQQSPPSSCEDTFLLLSWVHHVYHPSSQKTAGQLCIWVQAFHSEFQATEVIQIPRVSINRNTTHCSYTPPLFTHYPSCKATRMSLSR